MKEPKMLLSPNEIELLSLNIGSIKNFEEKIFVNLLRNEAHVLSLIKEDPGMSVKHYMSKSSLSYRGFFNVLNTLISQGLIQEEECMEDRRRRLLR